MNVIYTHLKEVTERLAHGRNGVGPPVVLQDGTNTYVYGLDLISATDNGGAQTHFLYDGLGSTANVTSGSGTTLTSYSYDVFGAIRSQTVPHANHWLFTGEQRDSGSNLYYLRARYYDPSIGRFLSQDPVSGYSHFPQSQHTYAYAYNNPVVWTDPSGQFGIPITAAVGAVVGGTAAGLSTLAVDVLEDGKINKSWQEYGWNIGRGALIGGLCGSGTGTALCVALLTAGTSIPTQLVFEGHVDPCQVLVESVAAGAATYVAEGLVGALERGWKGPYGRTDVKLGSRYFKGSRARHAYVAGLITLPFDVAGGLPYCGQGGAGIAYADDGKE